MSLVVACNMMWTLLVFAAPSEVSEEDQLKKSAKERASEEFFASIQEEG